MSSKNLLKITVLTLGLIGSGAAPADALPAECGELASQERYVSPAIASWMEALTRAFATLPNDKSELGYFNPPKYSGITGRPQLDVTALKALPKQDDLDRNSERALRVPVKGDRYGGGSIAFGGDLYVNENFKWRFSVEVPEDRSSASLKAWWFPITIQQPWLEWRADESKFLWHAEDAQTRVLCRLLQRGSTVKLYRGTILQEATLLEALKSALQFAVSNAPKILQWKLFELVEASRLVVEYYKARDGATSTKTLNAQSILDDLSLLSKNFESGQVSTAQLTGQLKALLDEKMRGTDYGAFFTSLERERAKGFAKGALLTFEFPVSVLLDLSRRHLLYVGIENDIEIAFLPGMELTVFVDGFRSFERI